MRTLLSSMNPKGVYLSVHQLETLSEFVLSRRGSQVIVIHPGSRYLRIGKASDVVPVSIPCVVARKCRTDTPRMTRIRNVAWPWSQLTADELLEVEKGVSEGKVEDKDPVGRFFR